MADGPLIGFRILDLTAVISGPFCTQLLGDLGADVIKIEPPEGDSMRRNVGPQRGGLTAAFLNFNRNKRSIVIDIKKEHGRDLVRRLAVKADALVENNRPGVADRLGIGYADIRRANPKIVYCSICGFPPKGRLANFPAYDPVIQGYSGMAYVQGLKAGQPTAVKMALADKVSGMTAALAVVSALHAARARGVGQYIKVPMLEAMMAFTANDSIYGYTLLPEDEFKRLAPKSTTLDPFKTKDGWLTIAPFTDAQSKRLAAAVGHPEWWPETSDRTERAERGRNLMRGLAKLVPGEKHRRVAADARRGRHPLRPGAQLRNAADGSGDRRERKLLDLRASDGGQGARGESGRAILRNADEDVAHAAQARRAYRRDTARAESSAARSMNCAPRK